MIVWRTDTNNANDVKVAVMLLNHSSSFHESSMNSATMGDYGVMPWKVTPLKQNTAFGRRLDGAPILAFVACKIRFPHEQIVRRLNTILPDGCGLQADSASTRLGWRLPR
jgi:hypothetical protein